MTSHQAPTTAPISTPLPTPLPAPLPARIRIGAAVGLLLLSPICAEYLIGYDQIIS
ncbi:hypothetical protein G3M58_22795, partial [Streptomyces sp. SID7499]|nr:hypothetical protein [Streptomyces sp. SID7499]